MAESFQVSAKSWLTRARQITGAFFNFVLPPVCANCKKVGSLLCADCIAMMPYLQEPLCPYCGRIVVRPVKSCWSCRHYPLALQQVRAAVLFDGPVPEIIHNMKYNGFFAIAEPLATIMADAWPRWQAPVDLVVPIPLHPERERLRGYNQSALLVRHFCRIMNLPEAPKALRRIKHTQPQVGLSADARQANVAGAFQADPERIKGKAILLVDDVCTTGATLSEAATSLLAAGAKTVSGYCVARAT